MKISWLNAIFWMCFGVIVGALTDAFGIQREWGLLVVIPVVLWFGRKGVCPVIERRS